MRGDRSVDFGGEPQLWSGPQRRARCGTIPSPARSDCKNLAAPPWRETLARADWRRPLSDQSDRIIAVASPRFALMKAGYLRTPLDGVAQLLGCEVQRPLRRSWLVLQQFDPGRRLLPVISKSVWPLQLREPEFGSIPQCRLCSINLPLARRPQPSPALVRVCHGRCRRMSPI